MESKRVFLALVLMMFAVNCDRVLGGNIPAGKYNEESNDIPQKPEFRSRNVVQVWEKAERMGLNENKMKELKALLTTHDQKAYQLKKDSREGKAVGELEAHMKVRLEQIMQRFGMLRGAQDNEKASYNDINREFEDQRLEQLWRHAQKKDHFNQEELEELRRELQHHQNQVLEYNKVAEDLYGPLDKSDKDQNRSPKEGKRRSGQDGMDPALKRAKEIDLKLKHRDLNKDYQRLKSKMTPEEERGGFTDRRVISLWDDAVAGNFTEEELESIKQELQHFQAKLENYEDVQKQALREEKMFHNLKSRGEEPDIQKHLTIREKARNLGNNIGETINSWRQALASGRIHKEL